MAVTPQLPRPEDLLRDCVCCPRNCHADRLSGKLGYCRSGAEFGVGSLCVHRGEEPIISGPRGICNLFFTHCNLQCVYCQNYQISRNIGPLIEEHLELRAVAHRIEEILDTGIPLLGFVSPSHAIPQMLAIIRELHARGRHPGLVYNSGGYDKVEILRALERTIDVYLPDLKYMDPDLARQLSDAADYPAIATAALREMYRQKGSTVRVGADGYIQSGLIVRHLVIPGHVENSKRCLRFIAEELSPDVHVSLMAQYQPTPAVAADPALRRRLTRKEYEEVLQEMEKLGIHQGYTQELASADFYDPDFERDHPFE